MAIAKKAAAQVKRRLVVSGASEHLLATPRSERIAVRYGNSKSKPFLRENEKTGALIDGIAKATRKPGISREVVFRSRTGRPVYAYSVYPSDTKKIVREDAQGQKTIGRFVQGKFKALRSKTV